MTSTRLGDRLRHLRDEIGLSQDDLADRSGVSRIWISKIERNLANPSAEILISLAAALAVSVDTLLGNRPVTLTVREKLDIWAATAVPSDNATLVEVPVIQAAQLPPDPETAGHLPVFHIWARLTAGPRDYIVAIQDDTCFPDLRPGHLILFSPHRTPTQGAFIHCTLCGQTLIRRYTCPETHRVILTSPAYNVPDLPVDDLSQLTVHGVEHGIYKPPADVLDRLLKAVRDTPELSA